MLEANKDKFEAYNKQVDEYAVEADKYLAELEKYNKEYAEYEKKAEVFKEELEAYQNTSFADYMKAMEQYQIDSKKESMLSKKYGADLVLYESDMKRYEKELEEYKVKKAEYDKTIEKFTKEYGTPEEARKKLAELKQREKDITENKEIEKARYDKAKGEADKYKEKKVKLQTEKDKNLENYKKINSYRNHTEVLLEGISSVIKNGKVTRDNLFANTWINKNACKGKKLNNEEAKEAYKGKLFNEDSEQKTMISVLFKDQDIDESTYTYVDNALEESVGDDYIKGIKAYSESNENLRKQSNSINEKIRDLEKTLEMIKNQKQLRNIKNIAMREDKSKSKIEGSNLSIILLICIALLGLLIGANIANGFNYFLQKKN
jgi:hypothetical protein